MEYFVLRLGIFGLEPCYPIPDESLSSVAAAGPALGWASLSVGDRGCSNLRRTNRIEASFDLYRHLLYKSLRWQLPDDPAVERRVGKELTRYLWRGF
ncbi:MAG: hypothetical protein HC886_17260 [Leptolyngbyaceae cyanobacterium SM1_1_3]|nr:hypothetical protein [Leptolyngbyaceae cyanobacterium SM1_1_3]